MFPTAAKLVSGLCLAAVAFVVSQQIVATMPETTDFGVFVPFNMALGAAVGWFWLGRQVGSGLISALSHGLTAAILLFLLAAGLQGGNEMMRLAMLGRYGGPFDAVGAIFVESVSLVQQGVTPQALGTLALGGMATALLSEWTARRFA